MTDIILPWVLATTIGLIPIMDMAISPIILTAIGPADIIVGVAAVIGIDMTAGMTIGAVVLEAVDIKGGAMSEVIEAGVHPKAGGRVERSVAAVVGEGHLALCAAGTVCAQAREAVGEVEAVLAEAGAGDVAVPGAVKIPAGIMVLSAH